MKKIFIILFINLSFFAYAIDDYVTVYNLTDKNITGYFVVTNTSDEFDLKWPFIIGKNRERTFDFNINLEKIGNKVKIYLDNTNLKIKRESMNHDIYFSVYEE